MRKNTLLVAMLVAAPLAVTGCSEYRDSEGSSFADDRNAANPSSTTTETKREYRETHGDRRNDRTEVKETETTRDGQVVSSERSETDRSVTEPLPNDSPGTLDRFRKSVPSIKKFVDRSYAYIVFPKIDKGGAVVGAAAGKGDVYEQGRVVGTAHMSQVTVGAQLGGQTYSEVVFIQDKSHFDVFKDGNLEFAANASAIASETGADTTNDFREGVAVFTLPRGGLMVEAAIGGQKFSYAPNAR